MRKLSLSDLLIFYSVPTFCPTVKRNIIWDILADRNVKGCSNPKLKICECENVMAFLFSCLCISFYHISATLFSSSCTYCCCPVLILTAIRHLVTTDELKSRQQEKEKQNFIRCTETQFADTHKCKHFYSPDSNPPAFFLQLF